MTITARYPGQCTVCGGPIRPGDQIEWSKGGPLRHTVCPQGQPEGKTTGHSFGQTFYLQMRTPQQFRRCVECGRALRSGDLVRYRYPAKELVCGTHGPANSGRGRRSGAPAGLDPEDLLSFPRALRELGWSAGMDPADLLRRKQSR